jgi:ATP synthase protein I
MGDRGPGDEGKRREDSGLRPYLKFAHLGTQMTLVLLGGVFGGIWLDGKWGTDPILTVVGSLAGIGIGLYIVIRETGAKT